jgi:hypothetical protein
MDLFLQPVPLFDFAVGSISAFDLACRALPTRQDLIFQLRCSRTDSPAQCSGLVLVFLLGSL